VPLVCGALGVLVWVVFGQTLEHGFVNYDDDAYVYQNTVVARGLTVDGVVWAFTRSHAENWHPVTWLSHMLDCQVYGLAPGGHHLTSVLLHAAASVLLFLVLLQMTGALWRSAFVAAVFAVHPLRVESVAWVSERKDVLSAVFFLLTLGAYVRYTRQASAPGRYLVVVLLFALGLMSKPMLVTVPVVLLLLDYWPLARFPPAVVSGAVGTTPPGGGARALRRLLLEKLPLLALAAASVLLTLVAQRAAIKRLDQIGLGARVGNAFVSYVAYLGDLVLPVGRSVFRPFAVPSVAAAVLAAAILGLLTTVAIRARRERPYVLVGWLWYVVMLTPVIGIVQVGMQARADRYTYLPEIGLVLLLTWLVADAARPWRAGATVCGVGAAAVILALVVSARAQVSTWRSSETLWTAALAQSASNHIARGNLGAALLQDGRVEEAITQLRRALATQPGYREAHVNLGNALARTGRLDEAMQEYRRALELDPRQANAAFGLGNALLRTGRTDEAIAAFRRALDLEPEFPLVHNNLGNALLGLGRVDEATTHYRQALSLDPHFALAENNLGNALLQEGRVDEAIAHYRRALELDPGYAEAHHNLGLAAFRAGRVDEAIEHYQVALALRPDYADAHNNLGVAYLRAGRDQEAIAHYRKALELDPGLSAARDNLAAALNR
jgi:tetratricopeptide (TPR) repeat protein